jgi:N-carbamoyl-L-amino-acid hydrolase
VVTGIVGIRHVAVKFVGTSNHAGTTPMDSRSNALLAACEFVLAVDRVVKSLDGMQVGTVGHLTVSPGVPNVIPGEVDLTVEIRDLETTKIDAIWRMLLPELEECSAKHGVSTETDIVHALEGVKTDPNIHQTIAVVSERLGLTHCRMPSGAGHDAQNLAKIAPTGMIFVPSLGGVSHSREEFTNPEDVANGANVLLNSLLILDQNL